MAIRNREQNPCFHDPCVECSGRGFEWDRCDGEIIRIACHRCEGSGIEPEDVEQVENDDNEKR